MAQQTTSKEAKVLEETYRASIEEVFGKADSDAASYVKVVRDERRDHLWRELRALLSRGTKICR